MRLSVVQEFEGTLTANLAQAERLRLALLRQARIRLADFDEGHQQSEATHAERCHAPLA